MFYRSKTAELQDNSALSLCHLQTQCTLSRSNNLYAARHFRRNTVDDSNGIIEVTKSVVESIRRHTLKGGSAGHPIKHQAEPVTR